MKDKNVSVITRRDFLRKAACAAVGTAAMTSAIRDLRSMNAAVAQSNISDYKALVLHLSCRGNDSNNMIMPTSRPSTTITRRFDTVLAIPQSSLLTLKQSDGRRDIWIPRGTALDFIRPARSLQQLFTKGKLAVLMNTGTLVMPITRAQYQSGGQRPPQLFSHADQVTQWQTSVPDQPALTGWVVVARIC